MSVTSGFFNSLNGDRRYNAEQMSSIFDGIINDGVFSNIGTAFAVKSYSKNIITIGIGRAWFNSTWLYNDAILQLTADSSEVLLDRYDAVVIEIDRSDDVREGSIKIINGTPSSNPQVPSMSNTDYIHQYPLAYIYRKAGSSEITQDNITNMVGSGSCPYITGILQVIGIDNIVAQWGAEWNQWFSKESENGNNDMAKWISDAQLEFNTWFNNLKTILDGDVATKLSEQITELTAKFETLTKEYCIYQDVDDSDGNGIEDSYGTLAEGKIVYRIA